MRLLITLLLMLCAGCGSRSPESYVKSMVIDPLPTSMKLVKVIRLFDPTLGDGYCHVAYTISAEDCALILKSRNWQPNLLYTGTDPQKEFASIWPSPPTELELYHHGSEYPVAEMILSKDHTRLILMIHQ